MEASKALTEINGYDKSPIFALPLLAPETENLTNTTDKNQPFVSL